MKLKDKDLRRMLMDELNQKYKGDETTRIINELGIANGSSRVDVAVVNGILHGYELKSEVDTLKRLPRQMEYYNRIFERMTIIVARKYLCEVKEIVPKWWGIGVVSSRRDKIIYIRKGRKINKQDKELLLRLLWKEDLEELVDVLGYPKNYKRKKKYELFKLFMEDNNEMKIKEFVYDTLKKREY